MGRANFPRVAHAVLLVLLSVLPAAALDLPALSGRVVDEAGILDQATRAALTEKLAALEQQTSDQLVVVTLKSLQGTAIEEFGVALGRRWQLGQKGRNNGALLIVAPNERKVRIEVGYGLEGALTDAVSRLIIENAIIPRFRTGDFAGGITRGVDDIVSVLTGDAEEWKRRAAQRPDPHSDVATLLIVLLVLGVFVVVFLMMAGSAPRDPRYRGGRPGGPFWDPSWGTGTGGFGGGGGWSGGSSGGGFSGGGGSFGGGGASGSW